MPTTRLARVGDRVTIDGHRVGQTRRTGEIREVLGTAGHERYLVRWADGHEAVVYPGADLVVTPPDDPEDEPVLVHEP